MYLSVCVWGGGGVGFSHSLVRESWHAYPVYVYICMHLCVCVCARARMRVRGWVGGWVGVGGWVCTRIYAYVPIAYITCFLKKKQVIYAMGCNTDGQLGLGAGELGPSKLN
jgi:hypothetical protein